MITQENEWKVWKAKLDELVIEESQQVAPDMFFKIGQRLIEGLLQKIKTLEQEIEDI